MNFLFTKLLMILYFSAFILANDVGEGLSGQELINFLKEEYTPSSILSYDKARDTLYQIIERNEDGAVNTIYSNYMGSFSLGQDPSSTLYSQGIDCEHLWPQSMYDGTDPKSDMHHLRPCKGSVNNYRGNKPYNEIFDDDVQYWFLNDLQLTYKPNNDFLYSEGNSAYFEPRESVKGDIARSLFYVATIYDYSVEADFFDLQKDVLKYWHYIDPPNEEELNRSWEIAYYQSIKPNPFILDSSLVERAYFNNSNEIIGNINLDDILDIRDLLMIMDNILNNTSITVPQFIISDVNYDYEINVVDVIALIQIILGET